MPKDWHVEENFNSGILFELETEKFAAKLDGSKQTFHVTANHVLVPRDKKKSRRIKNQNCKELHDAHVSADKSV